MLPRMILQHVLQQGSMANKEATTADAVVINSRAMAEAEAREVEADIVVMAHNAVIVAATEVAMAVVEVVDVVVMGISLWMMSARNLQLRTMALMTSSRLWDR